MTARLCRKSKHIRRPLRKDRLKSDQHEEAGIQHVSSSVQLAQRICVPQAVWMDKAALAKVLAQLGKDKQAEAQFTQAVQ